MIPLQALYAEAMLRLSGLTWLDGLDLLLVAIIFYVLLSLMQHSRVALLLRGILVLGIKLIIVMILLPLPVFDWLVRATLATMIVALPIIFQPELRRLLEQLGRFIGFARGRPNTGTEPIVRRLVRAVEHMSTHHVGALIVLAGSDRLHDVAKTGVPIDGQVSSELLQAIFYPDNPLHDGAVVLRGDRVVAAGSVLPLTQRPLHAQRRLGTRHRAAAGLSEVSDALVIVVSEETGEISLAHNGQLRRPLDGATLRTHLFDFYSSGPRVSTSPISTVRHLLSPIELHRSQAFSQLNPGWLLSNARLVFISLALALVVWMLVPFQASPVTGASVWAYYPQTEILAAGSAVLESPSADISSIKAMTSDPLGGFSVRSVEHTGKSN